MDRALGERRSSAKCTHVFSNFSDYITILDVTISDGPHTLQFKMNRRQMVLEQHIHEFLLRLRKLKLLLLLAITISRVTVRDIDV